ncbi:MAG: Twin-arginine translocation protein TatA [Labilithrix sp.]|nr:Twin-arginine translocation protein TatA [Labilithrix sp.]
MGSIGAPELIVIALIALLLFGAGRIADIGKGLGQGIKNFKQGLKEAGDDGEEPAAAAKELKGEKEKPKLAAKKEAKEEAADEA